MFDDRTVLVTGGTGSFGSTVVRALLRRGCPDVRVLSRDEKKQDDMRRALGDSRISFHLGDIRDPRSLQEPMSNVDYVFHAAALKQVPSCEFFPIEAVKTNVLGTDNVLRAARESGASRVVCLSTDKAAYPINAMGISKALMEKVYTAHSRHASANSCVVSGTRYGNVIASRGSVIPLFIEQLCSGRALTVTDPDMTRFLMTLDDAVELVFFGFERAEAGDLMIQKSPAARVGDIATAVGQLLGVKPDLKIVGSRHGEKMHEVLLTQEEAARAEDLGSYFRVPADNRDLNYGKYLNDGSLSVETASAYASDTIKPLSVEGICELLRTSTEIRELIDDQSRA